MDDRVVPDHGVIPDADPPADQDAVADPRAPRHEHGRGDGDVLADLHIVRDVDEVIELGAPADPRHPKHRPVHRRVGPDLHVVLEDDPPDLGDVDVAALRILRVPEPIAADHGAAL